MAKKELRERVASAVAWSIAEKVGSALLQMVVSIVVLNRLLPLDVGIIALLSVFTTIGQVVVDSGFSQTLIRKKSPTQGEYSAVFGFNLITSMILYALLTLLAPLMVRYYGWEMLGVVAPVLFLLLPINALCVIQNTIMVREFRFAELSTINFLSSAVSGGAAIAMALTGFGIWSLVAQRLLMLATKALLLWLRSPWRPYKPDMGSLREMAPYSLRLMTTELINSIYNNISQLFIGKRYSVSALGLFNQAQKLKDLPVNSTMQSIQSVTFPALTRIVDQPEKFVESYRRVVMMTAFIMFPVMAGLIATAEDIFLLLLKEQWHDAIPYFRILCLVGLFYPIAMVSYNILKVKSNGSIILRLEVVKKIIMTIILAVTIPLSVEAIAWGLVANAFIEMGLNFVASQRFAKLSLWSFLRTLLPIAIATAAMYVGVLCIGDALSQYPTALRLGAEILGGIALYPLLCLISRMESIEEFWQLAKSFFVR